MNWKFFKSNWFSIALVCIILLAIVRKELRIHIGHGKDIEPVDRPEKLTESLPVAPPAGNAISGLLPDLDARPAVSQGNGDAFVKRFAQVAISEKKKYGIPASVILAAAFINSGGGQRPACLKLNNFFALPCSTTWEGATAVLEKRCYRRYETPWKSFRDFSIHLTSQEWFGTLRKTAGKNWQSWVSGLHEDDLSDQTGFRDNMTRVITAFHLYELDNQ